MSKRNVLVAGLLLLFTAVAGWTAWWFFLATYAERAAIAATADGAETRLAYGAVERFGFPLRVGLRFTDFNVVAPWGAGKATLDAGVASFAVKPWSPRTVSMTFPDGLGYGATAPSPTGRLSGSARYGEGDAAFSGAGIATLRLRDVDASVDQAPAATAKYGQLVWRRLDAARQAATLSLSDITMDETAIFGPAAESAELRLVVEGDWPTHGRPDEIARWRDGGGRVDVEGLAVKWGALDLTGAGALGLDDAFRVAGGLNLKIADGDAIVDRLQALGYVGSTGAAAAKTVIAVAELQAGGGRAVAPLLFADGQATLAGFPIARLTPVCDCR